MGDPSQDLGPFGDIVEVREQPDGSYNAYDADGAYLLSLDAGGYNQVLVMDGIRLKTVVNKDGMRMSFDKVREKAKPLSFAVPYGTTGMVFQEPVRFLVDQPVFTKRGTAPTQIEGQYLKNGDRLLLTGQPDAADNGIYMVVKAWEDRREGGTWSRLDTPEGGTVLVQDGLHADTLWTLTGHYDGWLVLQTAGPGYTGDTITIADGDVEPPANHPDDLDSLLDLLME